MERRDQNRFFQWGFELLIVGGVGLGVQTLRNLNDSVSDLNNKIGIMLVQQNNLEHRVLRLEAAETDRKRR